jgi:hypothetical protein
MVRSPAQLLPASDVVVLSTAHARHWRPSVGADCRRSSAARSDQHRAGKLVDDAAVAEALGDGRLGGAALDVFTREPLDASSPYWDLPNVIVTPHTAGAMADYWTPLLSLFAENLRRFERGQTLLNVVDKQAGY